MLSHLLLSSLLLIPSLAAPAPQAGSATTTAAVSVCTGNTAADRSVWCDYDISTDYYNAGPTTGEIKEYWLEVQNITAAPDGVERMVLAVNGTVPGPTIEANWGDTVVIHVTNSLANNGSGIHWHGIRQNYTNQNDGVPSITQCPIAPGDTMTYTWKATQYGTSWYHSHYSLQAWEGVFGPIVIHGPATSNYDIDVGPIVLTDWSHRTVDEIYQFAQTRGPPTLDNGLINGTNTYTDGDETVGSRFETTFTSGEKHLLRFVNAAIDTHFKFMIDNHTMTVIAIDFVPVEPFEIEVIDITMGQRYDVIVEADQADGDYWLRAIPQSACSSNTNADDIKGIIRYDASSTSDPTTTGYSFTDGCIDIASTSLVPYVSKTVGAEASTESLPVAIGFSNSFFKWRIGTTSMAVEWEDPSLLKVYNNETTWEAADAVHLLSEEDQWVYFVIETTIPVPHPIHLHGHDFFILASAASATFDSSTVTLNTTNPPRRDVVVLPSSGYVVMAFETDNPGAWLMHCHIGWHTSEGLALQFVERYSEIQSLIDYDMLENTCSAWNEYQTATGLEEEDSGV